MRSLQCFSNAFSLLFFYLRYFLYKHFIAVVLFSNRHGKNCDNVDMKTRAELNSVDFGLI